MNYEDILNQFHSRTEHLRRVPPVSPNPNMMTPEVLGCFMVNGDAIEVSYGRDFNNRAVFGVTYNRPGDTRSYLATNLSQVYESLGV